MILKMNSKKERRYKRIYNQLHDLLQKSDIPLARMASISAVLYHKMENFFWCGFYMKGDDSLVVGPYQGPVACMHLQKNQGVCWAAVETKQTLIIPDVSQFPDHIACDGRSKSEIVIPLFDTDNHVIAVMDVDSDKLSTFDEIDKEWLEKICSLIFKSSK